MNEATRRDMAAAVELCLVGTVKLQQDCITTLRQIIEKGMARPLEETEAAS